MNENERLSLERMITENNVQNQTDKIRTLKHSDLIKNDVREINFAVGYKSAIIKNYINSLNILKKINYNIIDSGDVDIIKRISKITDYLDKDVLIIYGDTYTDINISNLIKFHKKNKLPASVVSIPFKTNFGLFKISKKNVVFNYKEKPILDEYINIGYFIFNKKLFKILNKFKKFESLLLFEKSLNSATDSNLFIMISEAKFLRL